MESITTLLILLLSVAVVIVVVACVVIFGRRRQAQSAADEARRKAAEERQRREVEQEVVRRAEDEKRQQTERHRLEEEAQRAEDELRRTEEERKRLEDEAHRKEEAQRKAEEEERRKAEAESKRVRPENRGGGPRGPRDSIQGPEKQSLLEGKPRYPKPEIVCWKRERQWIPGVEVPEELFESPNLTVLQNGQPLTQDESREGCWRLERASGEVVVQWNEEEVSREIKIALGEENYFLFKLSGRDQKQGRRVKSPSSGSYLLIVPENWNHDEALSGPSPVALESVSLTGYQAHFFILGEDCSRRIAFRTPANKTIVVESKAPQFELVGTRLNDIEEMGPLFGERPPRIRALHEKAWQGVGTIVVGEEGKGKGKWRLAFSPMRNLIEQDLPSEIGDRKGGWYFVRFYDTSDDLIESLHFRFVSTLREIKVSQPLPLPFGGGHQPVCIEFLHDPGFAMQPADDLTNVQMERHDDKTILTIPPDPAYDETRWLVSPGSGPQVEVTILVERVWWAVGEEDKEPAEWKDKPLSLTRNYFAATSKKALWLRLPRRRWVNKILAGFEQLKARPYDVRVTEKTIAVPLRDFGDSEEVADPTKEFPFKVLIKCEGSSTEGVVAVIPASQLVVAPVPVQAVSPPTPHWIGFGRKKTAVAEAVLQHGGGEININGQAMEDYFRGAPVRAREFLRRLRELGQVSEVLSQMEAHITVTGSTPTITRQAKAVAHALARALMSYDSKLEPLLRQAGYGGVRVTKAATIERER